MSADRLDIDAVQRLEDTLDRLTAPMFTWRMARGDAFAGKWHPTTGRDYKSAGTRRANALQAIHTILVDYVNGSSS